MNKLTVEKMKVNNIKCYALGRIIQNIITKQYHSCDAERY